MPKTALVTGAHGFLGRHVAQKLASDGWEVVGLGHGNWTDHEWKSWGLSRWHESDVTMESLLACGVQPEAVIHCAGGGSVAFSINSPHQDFLRTVATTSAVLEFVRLHSPGAKVAYPSSGGVYGAVKKLPIEETAPPQPFSPYGVHKLMAEELCCSYSATFGLATCVVRFFSIYGAGLRKQLLWDACQKVLRDETSFFGTGEETRDWLHVSDAANLLVMAINNASVQSPVVNGGFGVGVSVREILEVLFRTLGRDDQPDFTGMTRSGDPTHYIADIVRASRWGWQPEVDWRTGIKDYGEWFKGAVL